jgi:hypothetical protein
MIHCGPSSPEQYIARIRARVARGGHSIPEAKIRERWTASRANLIQLPPKLTRLQVFDNSAEALPGEEIADPLLELSSGEPTFPQPDDVTVLATMPQWARPIFQAAIDLLG